MTDVAVGPGTVRVQCVLYKLQIAHLERALEYLDNAARVAVACGQARTVCVAYGDCSPEPLLDGGALARLRLQNSHLAAIDYSFFDANLGHGGGQNRLLADARSNFVFILNPDALVYPNVFGELLATLARPGVGLVEARQSPIEHPKDYDRATGETSWASMACALAETTLFQQLGGFDSESFFHFCDDVDFSWRVRLAGRKVVFQPSAAIFHDKRLGPGGSWAASEREQYSAAESALLLAHKYSRNDLTRKYLRRFAESAAKPQQEAAAAVAQRIEAGRMPPQLDPNHLVGQFVEGEYAVHRYSPTAPDPSAAPPLLAAPSLEALPGEGLPELFRRHYGLAAAQPSPVEHAPAPGVFLTVVTRSIGGRTETLRDALMSLAGQSDQDFELLLMAHNPLDTTLTAIKALVAEFPAGFAARIKLVPCLRPGRSAPLNDALVHARGRFIAVLDDDDFVFAHWVEEFRRMADANPGRLIRAVCAKQDFEISTRDDVGIARALSWFKMEWPAHYEAVDHFFGNFTPFMSMAFPRDVFFARNLRWDETLTTLEDWHLATHAAMNCGVASTPAVTSVYRWWTNGGSSQFAHDPAEWTSNRQAVLAQLNAQPIVLPPGAVARICALFEAENLSKILAARVAPKRKHIWTRVLKSLERNARRAFGREIP